MLTPEESLLWEINGMRTDMRRRELRNSEKLDIVLRELAFNRRVNHALWRKLNRIERTIAMASSTTQAAIDSLTSEVSGLESATDGVLAVLDGLVEQLRASKDDPAEIDALASRIETKRAAIAAAVTANTPAEDDGSEGGDEGGETPPTE